MIAFVARLRYQPKPKTNPTQPNPNPTQPKPELNPNVRFDLWLSARFALCEAFFAFPTLWNDSLYAWFNALYALRALWFKALYALRTLQFNAQYALRALWFKALYALKLKAFRNMAKATKSQTPNVKHHYESTGNLVAVANFQPFWSIFSHFEAFLAVLDKSPFNRTKKNFWARTSLLKRKSVYEDKKISN